MSDIFADARPEEFRTKAKIACGEPFRKREQPARPSDGPIPDWAHERADELAQAERARKVQERGSDVHVRGTFYGEALARYIAAHEDEPVDPLVECFDAIHGVHCLEGEEWSDKMARTLRAELNRRGYTIAKADSAKVAG